MIISRYKIKQKMTSPMTHIKLMIRQSTALGCLKVLFVLERLKHLMLHLVLILLPFSAQSLRLQKVPGGASSCVETYWRYHPTISLLSSSVYKLLRSDLYMSLFSSSWTQNVPTLVTCPYIEWFRGRPIGLRAVRGDQSYIYLVKLCH